MRIKYKAPGAFLFRRFWRVESFTIHADGTWTAVGKRRTLHLPAGLIVVVVGDK